MSSPGLLPSPSSLLRLLLLLLMPRDEAQGEEVAEGNWKGERPVVERGGLRKKVVPGEVVVVVGRGDKVRRGEEERRSGSVECGGEGGAGRPVSQSFSRGASSLVLVLGGRGGGSWPSLCCCWGCRGVFASPSARKKDCKHAASEAIVLEGGATGGEGAVEVWELVGVGTMRRKAEMEEGREEREEVERKRQTTIAHQKPQEGYERHQQALQ